MLTSKGAVYFRTRFLEFVLEELKNAVIINEGNNHGEDVTIQFFGAAIVGIVEWWFKNGKPYPPSSYGRKSGDIIREEPSTMKTYFNLRRSL